MAYFTSIPFETSIMYIGPTFFCIGITYLIRVKQSIQINKILYIILGTCIAFFVWMISIPIQNGLIVKGYNEYAVTIVFLVRVI